MGGVLAPCPCGLLAAGAGPAFGGPALLYLAFPPRQGLPLIHHRVLRCFVLVLSKNMCWVEFRRDSPHTDSTGGPGFCLSSGRWHLHCVGRVTAAVTSPLLPGTTNICPASYSRHHGGGAWGAHTRRGQAHPQAEQESCLWENPQMQMHQQTPVTGSVAEKAHSVYRRREPTGKRSARTAAEGSSSG